MTDIPLPANLEDYLVLAQRVELLVSQTSTGDTVDKLTTMRNLDLDIGHPESRTNHGLKRVYSHGAPDISLRFTLSVTRDILAYLRTRGLRNGTTGIIPVYKWAMKVTANDGTSQTIKINGKLTQKRYIKNDSGQGDPVSVDCTIRVTDDAEPTAS